MASDVITNLFPQVMSAASNIQTWGSMWYQASTDFIEFENNLIRLHRLRDLWFEEFRKYGGLLDEFQADKLNEAASLLKSAAPFLLLEVERLRSKEEARGTFCACLTDCWGMLCLFTFPTPIKARIKLVVDAFQGLSSSLQSDQDLKTALERMMLSRTYTSAFTFSNDNRYVSFEDSESKVHSALKNSKAVVLLHGGPGQGKSTLARHLALHYKDQKKTAQEGTDSALFDLVVYLECGPKVEISPKQLELLQQLGLNTTVFQQPGQSISDHLQLSEIVRGVLKDRKVLVILDDVWSVEFLQQMIDLCGSHVKCLVTSQRGDLFWHLNCSAPETISMQDIPLTVARRILASHVGFPNQQIPDGLIMDEAEKIIQETRGNPLALASVAAAIPRNRAYDVTEWKIASKRFLQLLKIEDTALIHSKKYPKSFWSAMQFSVESLTKDAQKVLTLMHLCEGTSIPQEVIEYLHQTIGFEGYVVPFQTLRNELESRELLKITSTVVDPGNDETEHSWSTHSLQKKFMEEEKNMQDLKKLMLESLIRLFDVVSSKVSMEREIGTTFTTGEEAFVQLAFCALYLDKQFAKKAASKIGIPYDECTNLRRDAIEPVARLLVQLDNDSGTASLITSARQIFLRYTCDGILHHDGITHLLASTICIRPMLTALINIALVAETLLMEIRVGGWLQELVNLLSNDGNPHFQQRATLALGYLALQNLESTSKIIDFHGTLQHLSKFLSAERDLDLQLAAVWTLLNVTWMGGSDSRMKVFHFPGILQKLIDLLSKDSNPSLQELAVKNLGNLGLGGEEARSTILDCPGVLQHLSNFLSANKDLDLQLAAVWALENLTGRRGSDSTMKVFHFPGILPKLVDLLSKDSNPGLQTRAVMLLGELGLGGEEATSTILDCPGVLDHLSNFLSANKDLDLQLAAVRALADLTWKGNLYSKKKLLTFPGVLEKLINFLSGEKNAGLEEIGATILANLATGGLEMIKYGTRADTEDIKMKLGEDMKVKLKSAEGLIEALLGLLAEGISPTTQAPAVFALTVISPTRGNEACLFSSSAYSKRGYANLTVGLNKEALTDFDKADKLEPGDLFTLRHRSTVRARLKDYTGALDDAEKVLEVERTATNLQERGVLKRMMGDWPGALADLNEGLNLECDDYEQLKHRGYVRFLMGDKEGARSDAELAIKVKPTRVDLPTYPQNCLGTTSVDYLEYKLR